MLSRTFLFTFDLVLVGYRSCFPGSFCYYLLFVLRFLSCIESDHGGVVARSLIVQE